MTELLGHERTMGALRERLASGKLAHAYLFSGIAGVGKKRAALELARAFLCGNAADGVPCDRCDSCRVALALKHPDMVLVHDIQALRWEDVGRLAALFGGDTAALAAALDELREHEFTLAPSTPSSGRRRIGLTLDPANIYRSNVLDPTPFAERLARMEERGRLSAGARRLAATLYYDETSRYSYKASLGIHIIARREPLTPDRGSLREFLGRTSFHGGGKVVVIDDAERMTEDAQNAFLKTLEEPPQGSLVILVTHAPELLLPTIRSRSQEVRFGRLAPDLLAAVLREQGTSSQAGAFVAAWADGSLGRALEGELDGLAARRDLAVELQRFVAGGDIPEAMRVASGFAAGDDQSTDRVRRLRKMSRNLELLLLWYRDLSVAADHGTGARLLNGDLAAEITREAGRRPAGAWRASFDIVAHSLEQLTPSSDYRLHAEELVADLVLADLAVAQGAPA